MIIGVSVDVRGEVDGHGKVVAREQKSGDRGLGKACYQRVFLLSSPSLHMPHSLLFAGVFMSKAGLAGDMDMHFHASGLWCMWGGGGHASRVTCVHGRRKKKECWAMREKGSGVLDS